MRKTVFVLSHLRFHLHHIRASFLTKFILAFRLCQHTSAFVQLLACYPYACLCVCSIHVFLHHVNGYIVLRFLHRRSRIVTAQSGLPESINGGETVKHIQFGIKLIVVVECRHIIICISLRVDVSSPSILPLHSTRDGGQECGNGMMIVLLALTGIDSLTLHIRGMPYGILHTVVKAPALCRDSRRKKHPSYQYYYSFHNLPLFYIIRTMAVPKAYLR